MSDNNSLLDIPEFLRRNPKIKQAAEAYERTDFLDKKEEEKPNESKRNTRSIAA
mgnify:FL=1|tara:strand:+ start:114 stop:275 length:162 start_codon:yes stop_codon:yes gene_type:complete